MISSEANEIFTALSALSSEEKRRVLLSFFKTGKGEYGEGDQFLGVTVPQIRSVVRQHPCISLDAIDEMLSSPWHDMRLCALLALERRYQKAKNEKEKELLYQFYLQHTSGINNWDLVDLSAPKIVGMHLVAKGNYLDLLHLVQSESLWEQRIAIVSTLAFIRHGEFQPTLHIARLLLFHPHDLIHKAVGWMLREMGKKDTTPLYTFLEEYADKMPRTTLRYAIEKLSSEERKAYMKTPHCTRGNKL